jgi:hypothetical protein
MAQFLDNPAVTGASDIYHVYPEKRPVPSALPRHPDFYRHNLLLF